MLRESKPVGVPVIPNKIERMSTAIRGNYADSGLLSFWAVKTKISNSGDAQIEHSRTCSPIVIRSPNESAMP